MKRRAFSLAEMLVAMLVVAIIMALSTPMITKKTEQNNSLSFWTGLTGGNIAFNQDTKENSVIIGGNTAHLTKISSETKNIPKLSISTKEKSPHIGFIYSDEPSGTLTINDGISLGKNVDTKEGGIAIGFKAKALGKNSIAIGHNIINTEPNAIKLGNETSSVQISGTLKVKNLIVDGGATFSENFIKSLFETYFIEYGKPLLQTTKPTQEINTSNTIPEGFSEEMLELIFNQMQNQLSDKRLKNIISENTDSIEKLKEIKTYNYTFKSDSSKTPRVGVIAQELKNVFPNSVKKNNEGYYQIRQEDMFYAMLNTIKELHSQSETLNKRLKAQEEELRELKKEIENLKK